MKSVVWVTVLVVGCSSGAPKEGVVHSGEAAKAEASSLFEPNGAPQTVKVMLPSLRDGVFPAEHVFSGFGCTGENKPLRIAWSNAPADTKSFAVVIHDPDAPTGVGFFHWIVFDIPPTITSLPTSDETHVPEGAVQGYTDFGTNGYGGPCPPPGPAHRYIVTVYALDVPKLGPNAHATGALVRFNTNGHTLALGRAEGTYSR